MLRFPSADRNKRFLFSFDQIKEKIGSLCSPFYWCCEPGNGAARLLGGWGWGDRGAGARENRGREGYGRGERKGREAGVLRGREAGQKCKTVIFF